MNKFQPKYLFVYGTLKRGFSNDYAQVLHNNSTFIGEASVKGRLYFLDNYPGLILDESGYEIFGEVFRVDSNVAEVLELMDEYEGVDEGYYIKKSVTVRINNEFLDCLTYETCHFSDKEILNGRFR